MKILINAICAKRHAGGGFQISLNFVRTALTDTTAGVEWYFLLSDHVAEALSLEINEQIFIFPAQPDFNNSYCSVRKSIHKIEDTVKPDVVYSLVAPSYFIFKSKEVMRYTNPWVVHPNPYARKTLSFTGKLRNVAYIAIHKYLLRKCKYFITQTNYTAKCIAEIARVPQENVCVVSNVLPAIYKSLDNTPISDPKWINITSVAAPFPHKNLDIIPEVLRELQDNHGIKNVRFHVTIPNDSSVWKAIESRLTELNMQERVINHGRMSQEKLAELYRSAQVMFLPTLLEVFSASIIEAMYFDMKIVASDFPFNSSVIGDAGFLFEPTDAKDAADKIAEIIMNPRLQQKLSERMSEKLKIYGDYQAHFDDIKTFLMNIAAK